METKRTRWDVEGEIKPILPNLKFGVQNGQFIIRTGLKVVGKLPTETLEGILNLQRDKDGNQIGKECAENLFHALNWMGQENEAIKGFMDQVECEHRTLQQNFGHLLIAAISHFAEMYEKNCYDARNEGICKLCAELKPITEKAYLPFI